MMNQSLLRGEIWSATPTPLTDDFRVDRPSVQRMVEHHLALGVSGLMLAGTCREGPWLARPGENTPDAQNVCQPLPDPIP